MRSVCVSCDKARQWRGAMEAFSSMREAGVGPSAVTFAGLVSACGRAGELALVEDLWAQMLAAGTQKETDSFILEREGHLRW